MEFFTTQALLSGAQKGISGLLWIAIIFLIVKFFAKLNLIKIVGLFASGAIIQWLIYHYSSLSTLVDKIAKALGF